MLLSAFLSVTYTHTVYSLLYTATPLPATFSSRYRLGLRAPFELRVLPTSLPPSSPPIFVARSAGRIYGCLTVPRSWPSCRFVAD